MRSIGVIGAILFSVPNVMMAFVHQVLEMAVIFFLQGIGLGLMFTICNTNFNAYFDKKRSMVLNEKLLPMPLDTFHSFARTCTYNY
jgi:MFS family permease